MVRISAVVIPLIATLSLGMGSMGPVPTPDPSDEQAYNQYLDNWSETLRLKRDKFAEISDVLNRIEKVFKPYAEERGQTFRIDRYLGRRGEVAKGRKQGKDNQVLIHGGFYTAHGMTTEIMSIIACHEVGHVLGGGPIDTPRGRTITIGAQADYFATAKCLRMIYSDNEQLQWLERNEAAGKIDDFARAECAKQFTHQVEFATCLRSSMAALNAVHTIDAYYEVSKIKFENPSTEVVDETFLDHARGNQCRLDTLFAGALCNADPSVEFSYTEPTQGACMDGPGARPRCWYAPMERFPILEDK
jgi:hypothetical protein